MRHIILGKGGHAQAWRQCIEPSPGETIEFTENNADVKPDDVVHIGVGRLNARVDLFEFFKMQVWADPAGYLPGVQRMMNTHIGPNVRLGHNVLINTGAIIEHDCKIGSHCIISPGAILCGNVTLGQKCQIGTGVVILQGVEIQSGTHIPAGTLVVAVDDWRVPVKACPDV